MENTAKKRILDFSLVDVAGQEEEYIDMFKFYCEELSKEDPTIRQYDYTELAKENLLSSSDRPMFIIAGNIMVGFVVFMEEPGAIGDDDCHSYIGEIYVKPDYRNNGIASRIACNYLDSLDYDSGLCYIRKSYAEQF